jgi:hypothetical protein
MVHTSGSARWLWRKDKTMFTSTIDATPKLTIACNDEGSDDRQPSGRVANDSYFDVVMRTPRSRRARRRPAYVTA